MTEEVDDMLALANEGRHGRLVDYAEIEITRSGRGGNFERGQQTFPVPFVYQKRKWKVAGDFRGEDRWIRP